MGDNKIIIKNKIVHNNTIMLTNSTHVGLSTSVTGMILLFHSDPGYSPIQHSSVKLDKDLQTIRGGLQDKQWDTFIIPFCWKYSNSSFYIPQVWHGELPCSL